MATINETFAAWSAQLDGELIEAREAVLAAKIDLAAAEEAHATALAARNEMRETLLATGRQIPLALARLSHPMDVAVRTAEGREALAKGIHTNACRAVEDVESALAELQRLNSPEPSDPETAE
jgi:hypothetical protein